MIMNNQDIGNTPRERFASLNSMILNRTDKTCLDYNYAKSIRDLRNVTWEANQDAGGENTFAKNILNI